MVKNSIKKHIESMIVYLKQDKRKSALTLLKKALIKARNDTVYYQQLTLAILETNTVKLRACLSSFGDYWQDIRFSNDVDSIDTTLAYID
jgi:hypothetical protein